MLVAALLACSVPLFHFPEQNVEPLFEGLGSHHRMITTSSAEAQKYFDQGLAFLYAFNHDQAMKSFTQATNVDPKCAMAWWGIATANGPHINNPSVDPDHAKAAWAAVVKAKALSGVCSGPEKALIQAVSVRFAPQHIPDRQKIDRIYAFAMREAWRRYPKDADIGALFAESMMDLRPWDLWRLDGTPQPGTMEVVQTLRAVLRLDPNHPLGCHLYVHALEASPWPDQAVPAADRLREMEPALGHMVHMPSHIDVRTGQWQKAIIANEKAIVADRNYREKNPEQGFYRVYMVHNHHMLAYAATMRGERQKAIDAMDRISDLFPEDFLKAAAPMVDGYMAMPLEVKVRFGKWDDILAAPEFPDYFPIARTLRHGARAVAFAAKGDIRAAREEQALFYGAKRFVPPTATVGNSPASQVLLVAMYLMNGEILLAMKAEEGCLANLRNAVNAEDQLRYDEPPDWLQPTRHTLGAALLAFGHPAKAERVYRADLKKLPNNGWSLYGLSAALKAQGKMSETTALDKKFEQTWANADIEIHSSCLCVPGK
jgi:tetratricopeptide (TPR) repeat protein